MKLTVKDLMEYLGKQNPSSRICYYDSNLRDYVQLEDYLFKKVSNAKKDYEKSLRNSFRGLKSGEMERVVKGEMEDMFKFVEDEDILIGLKNNADTLDNMKSLL